MNSVIPLYSLLLARLVIDIATSEYQTCCEWVSETRKQRSLGLGLVLDLNLGVLGDHQRTNSLELLNRQETSWASVPGHFENTKESKSAQRLLGHKTNGSVE